MSKHSDARRTLDLGLFAILPVVITGWLLVLVFSHGLQAVDFRQSFYSAGLRTLHGGDPFSWTHRQIAAGVSFPYPALSALLFAPFALLTPSVAGAVFTALTLLAVLAALRALEVRDWRVYGAVLLWAPVVIGWQTANVSLLILLGLALCWRNRENPVLVGLAAAALISFKPIVLPLALWLLVSRRLRAFAWCAGWGVLLNLVSWTVLGWSAVGRWLHVLGVQGDLLYRKGYGIPALLSLVGAGRIAGTVAIVLIAGLIVLAIWVYRRRLGERGVFTLCVFLMIVISPQVDAHYFVLLIAPLALAFPRLHRIWLLPLLLWLCPAAWANAWQTVLWWAAAIAVVWLSRGRGMRGLSWPGAPAQELSGGPHMPAAAR